MPSESVLDSSGYDAFNASLTNIREGRGRAHFPAVWWAQFVAFGIADVGALAVACAALPWLSVSALGHSGAGGAALSPHGDGLIRAISEALPAIVLCGELLRRGHYTRRLPALDAVGDVIGAAALAAICSALVGFADGQAVSGLAVAAQWAALTGLLVLFRVVARAALTRLGLWTLRTLVVGRNEDARRVAGALRSANRLGLSVVGVVEGRVLDALVGAASRTADGPLLRDADCVVLVTDPQDRGGQAALLRRLHRERVPCMVARAAVGQPVATNYTYLFGHDVGLMQTGSPVLRRVARAAKRCFDPAIAALLLLALSPLLLAVAAAVRRDGGPVFYRHVRLGLGGRSFPCLKFRTMHVNADRALAELLARDPAAAAEWAATQKLKNDPRVTSVGQLLRKTSLDELPQLINVLRGEMSLVGPRPIVASELRYYGDAADDYFATRPGLTGLWQVSGRSDTSYERRVELDAWYVRNWTLQHDIVILLKTVPAVLLRRGAV